MDMLHLSALELSRKIRSGEISVKEAVSGYREQMQKMEPQVHAFLSVDDDKLEKRIGKELAKDVIEKLYQFCYRIELKKYDENEKKKVSISD